MKLLAIRFHALGDIAMTVPSIWALSKAYPEMEITVLSAPNTESIFKSLPPNVKFKGVNFKKDYNGTKGLLKLSKELSKEKYDYVADLNGVLRSVFICTYLKICGSKVAHINKGKREKNVLCKVGHTQHKAVKNTFQRYHSVFKRLGFKFDDNIFRHLPSLPLPEGFSLNIEANRDEKVLIGIAPFAKHEGKIYPLDKMKNVIKALSNQRNTVILLFGFGEEEDRYFKECISYGNNIHNLAGKYKLIEEVAIIQRLDVMLTMDSANMHIASLAGTPVVSIWGATHIYTGFLGWGQKKENIVEMNYACRPCSTAGKKACKFGDYRCMRDIDEKSVIDAINRIANK